MVSEESFCFLLDGHLLWILLARHISSLLLYSQTPWPSFMNLLDVVAGLGILGIVCPSDWFLGGEIMLFEPVKSSRIWIIIHATIIPYSSTYHTKMPFIYFPISLKPILHTPSYQELSDLSFYSYLAYSRCLRNISWEHEQMKTSKFKST